MQTIGNLAKQASTTPQPEASPERKSNGLPLSSFDTGVAPMQKTEASRATGKELGTTTSTATLAASLPTALAADSPDRTDRALEASLTLLLGSKPKPVEKVTYPAAGFTAELISFELPNMKEANRSKCLELIRTSLNPMTQSECFGLLGEMKLTTVCRPEQGHDLEAQLGLYARKLAEYPADVVRKVLTTQPNMSKWWPTWAELKDRLDLFSDRRRKLQQAMTTWKSPPSSTNAPVQRYVAPDKPKPAAEPEETDEEFEARKKRMIIDNFPG